MIDVENSLKRFKELKKYAEIGDGYIAPTLHVSEMKAVIQALEHYQLGNCMNDCEHYDNCSNYIYTKGYNKAIDDFYDKALNFEDYIKAEDIDGSCLLYAGRDITDMIVKIKNELIN